MKIDVLTLKLPSPNLVWCLRILFVQSKSVSDDVSAVKENQIIKYLVSVSSRGRAKL